MIYPIKDSVFETTELQVKCCIHSFDPGKEARFIARPQVCLRSGLYLRNSRVILSIHCNIIVKANPTNKQLPGLNSTQFKMF